MILGGSGPRVRCVPLVGIFAGLVLVVLAACSFGGSLTTSAGRRHGSQTAHEQAGMPPGARGPISAALGRAERAYWVRAGRAANPAQRLRATFGTHGVSVESGPGRLRLSLVAYGRRGALEQARTAAPQVRANRVAYRHGALSEWYVNGPLGLEHGVDLERAPVGGAGPLTLSLALSGNLSARIQDGAATFSRDRVSLRYGGLIASDARGHQLRSWLELSAGRLLIRVDDRRARYPVHVDPFIGQAELAVGDGAANDELGTSVAVSGDTVVAGAFQRQVGGHLKQGAAYVFVKPAAGWANTSVPDAVLTASDGAAGDWFGWSVAISGDTIVAGAPVHQVGNHSGQGSAYVFVRPTGGWKTTADPNAELTAGDGAIGDGLGRSVAVSGDTIVTGASQRKIGSNANQGAVYVFVKPDTGWNGFPGQAAELTASDGAASDSLGRSVAVSGDTIVAGAHAHDVAGNSDQGAAYVFVKPLTGWANATTEKAELTAGDGAADDQLGRAVGVWGDTVVAGADNHAVRGNAFQGTAYVFVRPNTGWASTSTPTAELTAEDGAANDNLGYSLAVWANTVVVGAPSHAVGGNGYQGASYVFVRPAGGWVTTSSPNGELTAGDGTANDGFGSSVAVGGNTILSGAPTHTVGIKGAQGAAYLFTRPAPLITVTAPRADVSYVQGQVVRAAFRCADQLDGSGLASCTGTSADGDLIDTGVVGPHSFAVIATDNAGEQSTHTVNYTVVPRPHGKAPTISRLTQTHRTWREGNRLATISRRRRIAVGTTFSFKLDQPARIVLVFTRLATGGSVGHRCVAETRTNRRRPVCRRAVAAGTLSLAGRAGADRISFQGRVSPKRRLTPGVHTLTVAAVDGDGQRSKPRSLTFTIVK